MSARVFTFPVRVYYEDTDAGGVVYHANYLRFMERARTEWLSHLGLEHGPVADEHAVVFVVRQAVVDYLKPARLSDHLQVEATVGEMRRSAMVFHQRILRGDEVLTQGLVTVVAVDLQSFRPRPIPEPLREALQSWLDGASPAG